MEGVRSPAKPPFSRLCGSHNNIEILWCLVQRYNLNKSAPPLSAYATKMRLDLKEPVMESVSLQQAGAEADCLIVKGANERNVLLLVSDEPFPSLMREWPEELI